jgi:hypothetical protein
MQTATTDADLEDVRRQILQIRAEIAHDPSGEAFAVSFGREQVNDDLNGETFGEEAAFETADDAINDETFGGEAIYEMVDGAYETGRRTRASLCRPRSH